MRSRRSRGDGLRMRRKLAIRIAGGWRIGETKTQTMIALLGEGGERSARSEGTVLLRRPGDTTDGILKTTKRNMDIRSLHGTSTDTGIGVDPRMRLVISRAESTTGCKGGPFVIEARVHLRGVGSTDDGHARGVQQTCSTRITTPDSQNAHHDSHHRQTRTRTPWTQ